MQLPSNVLKVSLTDTFPLILIFIIATDLSIFLDIHFFRQIICFAFLAILPGALLLCVIKPNILDLTEKFILSIGLSISFVMFVGILINIAYPIIGYESPLSIESLVFSLTIALLILTVIAHIRHGFGLFTMRAYPKLDIWVKAFLLIPFLFPLLSILGMHFMNLIDNNFMLIALLFLIPIYAILISVQDNRIPNEVYPMIIFLSSISLVLLLGLRSEHIIGADVHLEYYIFHQTFSNEKWQIITKSTIDSCLSISILPAIYCSFLNINTEYIFKIIYPFFFSVSPLIIYKISTKYFANKYAFLASIFFMSQATFLNTASNPRTTVAILFFALSIMIFLFNDLPELQKRLLLIIFIFSCIVSHYSTAYIFFFVLLSTIIGIRILDRMITYKKKSIIKDLSLTDGQNNMDSASQTTFLKPSSSGLTIGISMIFLVTIFIWYSQITGVAFDNGVQFFSSSLKSMQDFFILESRQESLTLALGYGVGELEISRKISFVFNWLTIFFIAIGVLTTLVKFRQRVTLSNEIECDYSGLLKKRIDIIFFSFAFICSALIVVSIAMPHISIGYSLGRTYMQMMVVLSTFFILGGFMIAELIHVKSKHLILLAVLVPFFMCTTGIMSQLFGYPGSITLNSDGDLFDRLYIHDQETFGAKWLKDYAQEDIEIYVDFLGSSRLISQAPGLLSSKYAEDFITDGKALGDGYIYLRYYGVVDGKLLDSAYNWHNITDYADEFIYRELIYANGGSEVWM